MATQKQAIETGRRQKQAAQTPPQQQAARRSGDDDGRGAQAAGQHDGWRQSGLMNINEEQLARGLGWFSLGLGLAEVLAPGGIAKIAGVRGKHSGFIRLMGLREIAHGIGIFAQGKRPAAAVWSRVVGDALDLAALGAAFASPNSDKSLVAFATANVLGVTALDVICAQQLSSRDSAEGSGAIRVRKSVVINRSPEELYRFWHDFQNLPRFMLHLESVKVTGEGRSHWVAKGPAGSTVEWDAEITEDRPAELIAWRSLEGSDVDNAGSVRFERATGGRGTIVRVEVEYNPPGGVVGAAVAKLFGEEPDVQISDDLRRFKQVVETGEVVISEATVRGAGALPVHPARPLAPGENGR
jgi:uncharacterized membrane protein